MQKSILFFVLILIFTGCKDDDYIIVSGKITREITGASIPNQEVSIDYSTVHGSGYFSTTKRTHVGKVTTDSNGNFSMPVKYIDNTSLIITTSANDEYAPSGKTLALECEDIYEEINVLKYVKFNVHVNNTSPYDEDDYIYIGIISSNGIQEKVIEIQNFGVEHTFYHPDNPPDDIPLHIVTSWYGINVNSIIRYKLPESTVFYKILSRKRKNGIETVEVTDEIPADVNQLTESFIDY